LLDEIRPFARPLLLAGGLQPGNIREAVEKVRPYGVDVSSGVESEPGKKCPLQMKAFIRELGLVGL
jgi:phosphoribosylanthranilate isomerase